MHAGLHLLAAASEPKFDGQVLEVSAQGAIIFSHCCHLGLDEDLHALWHLDRLLLTGHLHGCTECLRPEREGGCDEPP